MSDPYSDYFARDYLASKDFARMYGVDRPVLLRLLAFGVKEAKDPTNYKAPEIPKPVVWFVEHQTTPMFVNNTQHEYLLDRFGEGYHLQANQRQILHAPVVCKAWVKGEGKNTMHIVSWSGQDKIGQWAPMGTPAADKFRELVKDLRFTRDQFRYFVHECYPEVAPDLDSTERLDDLPVLFKPILEEFRQYLLSDLTPADARPRDPREQAPKPAPKPQAAPEPNFKAQRPAQDQGDDDDDIPF